MQLNPTKLMNALAQNPIDLGRPEVWATAMYEACAREYKGSEDPADQELQVTTLEDCPPSTLPLLKLYRTVTVDQLINLTYEPTRHRLIVSSRKIHVVASMGSVDVTTSNQDNTIARKYSAFRNKDGALEMKLVYTTAPRKLHHIEAGWIASYTKQFLTDLSGFAYDYIRHHRTDPDANAQMRSMWGRVIEFLGSESNSPMLTELIFTDEHMSWLHAHRESILRSLTDYLSGGDPDDLRLFLIWMDGPVSRTGAHCMIRRWNRSTARLSVRLDGSSSKLPVLRTEL